MLTLYIFLTLRQTLQIHYVRLHRRRQPQLAAAATRPEKSAPRVRRRDHAPSPELAPEPAGGPAVDPRKQRLAARQHATGRCRRAGAGAQRAPRSTSSTERRHAAGPLPPLQNNSAQAQAGEPVAGPGQLVAPRRRRAAHSRVRTRAAGDRGGADGELRAAVPSLSAAEARFYLSVEATVEGATRALARTRPGNEETTGRPPARSPSRTAASRRPSRAPDAFIRQAQQPALAVPVADAVVVEAVPVASHEPARSTAQTQRTFCCCCSMSEPAAGAPQTPYRSGPVLREF